MARIGKQRPIIIVTKKQKVAIVYSTKKGIRRPTTQCKKQNF